MRGTRAIQVHWSRLCQEARCERLGALDSDSVLLLFWLAPCTGRRELQQPKDRLLLLPHLGVILIATQGTTNEFGDPCSIVVQWVICGRLVLVTVEYDQAMIIVLHTEQGMRLEVF